MTEKHTECEVIPISALRGELYVVGPMSGHERWNWDEFRLVRRELGDDPMTPHQREARRDGFSRVSDWLNSAGAVGVADDLRGFAESVAYILDVRPALVAVRGWRDSEGTRAEVAVARRMRLPVHEVVYEDGVPVGVVLLSPDKTNECPRCGNSNEHSNPGTSDKEGQRG